MVGDHERRIVEDVLRRRGHRWRSIDRVAVGASNAVFEIELAEDRLVARVAAGGVGRYRKERAVMDAVRPLGVPCPEVVDVVDAGGWAVMLAEHLPGVRLAETDPDDHERAAITEACGAVLAAVHGVESSGFGPVDEDLRGPRAAFDEWFIDDLRRQVVEAGAPDLVAVADGLEEHRDLLRSAPAHLNHGDFSPMNILVHGGRVTGVVDWESAKSGPSALDFGWWDWFTGRWATPFPTAELVAAYQRAGGHDLDRLDELRALCVARISAGYQLWSAARGEPPKAEQ